MSGVDKGTCLADVPNPDDGAHAVAADAIPPGASLRRSLVSSAALELA